MHLISTKRIPGFRLTAGFVLVAIAFAVLPAAGDAIASTPTNSPTKQAVSKRGIALKQARLEASGRITNPKPPTTRYIKPDAPISFILDDGSIEGSIGFGTQGPPASESAAIWLNRFTPGGGFPITLTQIQVYWPSQGDNDPLFIGQPIKLLVYNDTDGDGNPSNATKLAEISASIGITNAFQTYNMNVTVNGPGDIYIGFEDFWAEPGYQPRLFPAAIDKTQTQQRSWIAGMGSGAPPDRDNLGGNDLLGTIENLSGGSISGNWIIRAYGNDALPLTRTPTLTPTRTPTPGCSDTGWISGPRLPTDQVRAVGVWEPASVVGGSGRFYVMGGRSADDPSANLVNPRYYNPATSNWIVTTASFPDNQVSNMACADLNGPVGHRIYCMGGSTAAAITATNRVAVYNPVANTFTTDDPWPGDADGITLPGGFAVVSNKLYVLGGLRIGTGMSQQIWQFDPNASSGSRWVHKNGLIPDPNGGGGLGYIPAAAIGNIIYTAGGSVWNSSNSNISDSPVAFSYDTVSDTVNDAAVPDLFAPGSGETRALNMGGRVWLIGGGRTPPNPSSNVLEFDPANPSAGWRVANYFWGGRRNFAVDTDSLTAGYPRIYLAGGYSFSSPSNDMQIYDPSLPWCSPPTLGPTWTYTPTNTPTYTPTISPTVICPGSWTLQAPYPAHAMDEAMAVQGGNLYSFSGVVTGSIQANSYKYSPTTNAWSQIAPLPQARENPSAVSDGTYIYILGGNDASGTVTSNLWRYDPSANSYITLTNYTIATRAQAAAYLNGKIYKIDGITASANTNIVEAYDIASDMWSTVASYPQSMGYLMAVALNGFIYASGGEDGTTGIANTYRYDPTNNTWDDAGIADLPSTRWGAASDVLQGKWVLAGGFAPVNDDITQGVLGWDPGTNAWSQIDSMLQPRARLGGGAMGNAFYAITGATPPFSFTGSQDNQRYTNTCTPSGIVNGHLTWQSIAAANRPSVTGTLSICVNGAPQNFGFTTDTNGNFTLNTSLPDGAYHWQVKGGRHLSNASPANGADMVISGGVATQEFGTQKGGDTNASNNVNSTDFNNLKNQFGQSGLKSADFDYSQTVNASDFNILKTNFGQDGHILICP